MLTFDIVLQYYDNPATLHNWLSRLLLQTDYLQLSSLSNILIADTGSPVDRIPDTLAVLKRWAGYKRVKYVWTDTRPIRNAIPPHMHARPTAHAFNVCCDQVSTADVICYSNLSSVPTPSHFRIVHELHGRFENAIIQPKQYRLVSEEYHRSLFDQPFDVAIKSGTLSPTGGTPDMSVRRKHLQTIGGWDEQFVLWGMADIDLICRLTGCIDTAERAEIWHQRFTGRPREPYQSLGLQMLIAEAPQFASIVCSEYQQHLPDADSQRANALAHTMPYFLRMWGQVVRNQTRMPMAFEVYENY